MLTKSGTLAQPVAVGTILAAVLATGGVAAADIIGPGLVVTATNSLGTASFIVELDDPFAETFPNGDWRYVLPDAIEMRDGDGDLIGRIDALRGDIFANPHVVMSFAVTGGALDTLFTITSGIETLGPVPAAVALGGGSAGITFGDSNGVDGVTVTGAYAGGDVHRMIINADGSPMDFTTIVGGPFFRASGTGSAAESAPGLAPGVTVTSISSEFSFTVSAGDATTGTSSFTVIPTPGAAALLGLGVISLGLRRKR